MRPIAAPKYFVIDPANRTKPIRDELGRILHVKANAEKMIKENPLLIMFPQVIRA